MFGGELVFVVEEVTELRGEGDDLLVPRDVGHRQSRRHRLAAVGHS